MLFVSYEELQKHINHSCNIPSRALDAVMKYEFAFECDPAKADYCAKHGCQKPCRHTCNPDGAKNFDLIYESETRKKYFEIPEQKANGMKKGVFVPEVTVQMFRDASLESVEEMMTSGTMIDVEIPSWIPVKKRQMTEEEYKEYEERNGPLNESERWFFAGQMPDDGQQILISTKYDVYFDTCEYDPEYGYGLEERGDWDGVNAWMPIPGKFEDKKDGEQ